MTRTRLFIVGSFVALLLLGLASSVSAAAPSAVREQIQPCSPFDWQNPAWPRCLAGVATPQPDRPPLPSAPPAATPTQPSGASSGAQRMLTLYNSHRTAAGRRAVVLNDALMRSAQHYAALLNRDQVHFPNNDPRWHSYGGTTVLQRIQAAGCAHPTTWGENIAVNSSVDAAFNAWFREGPGGGHYENIMRATFRQIGVGIAGRYYVVDHAAGC